MRTYIPDQWLRGWFLGGASTVEYSQHGQLTHTSFEAFVAELAAVWRRVGEVCIPDATLIVRFGAINDRAVNSLDLIWASLDDAGWSIADTVHAGTARDGRRQADHLIRNRSTSMVEHDVWATVGR
jgi:hypothetical protein